MLFLMHREVSITLYSFADTHVAWLVNVNVFIDPILAYLDGGG